MEKRNLPSERYRINDNFRIDFTQELEHNANGNVLKYISRNGAGEITGFDVYEYNTIGKNMKCIHYKGNGDITHWYEAKYDEMGRLVKWINHRADNTIAGWTEYQYDDGGNIVHCTVYDDKGTVTARY